MSERIYAYLLRLYPSRFREEYKEEAIQLYRDLYRHETGLLRRARLWVTLLADLAVGLPQAYRNTYVSPASSPVAQGMQGIPTFRLLEGQGVRPESFLYGSALALATLGTLSVVLSHPDVYHARNASEASRSPIESVLEQLNRPISSGLSSNESPQVDTSAPSDGQGMEARKVPAIAAQQALTPVQNRINPAERQKTTEPAVKNPEANHLSQLQSGKELETMPQNARRSEQAVTIDGKVMAPNLEREIQLPAIEIQRATIIAFGPPTTQAGGTDADASKARSDFQFYSKRAKLQLTKAGIEIQELHAHAFRIHLGSETTVFHPKTDLGYYLIALGKKPLIQYGVMTDADLLLIAKRYFGPVGLHD
jgi:hypothetical protein